MKGKKDFKSLVKVGRPLDGDEPKVTSSVSFDPKVLKALRGRERSVSDAVNIACINYYLIG